MMTEPELRAIIGHEFGHFRGADTAFTKRFFPLYSSAAKALAGMANAYGAWTLLPPIYMLHFFLVSFGKVQSALSRDREFLADNAGAQASSAVNFASALVKLELLRQLFRHLYRNVSTPTAPPSLCESRYILVGHHSFQTRSLKRKPRTPSTRIPHSVAASKT